MKDKRVTTPERELVSVPHAAVILGVSNEMVWSLVYEKRIASLKIGRLRRIKLKELQRFMNENTVARI